MVITTSCSSDAGDGTDMGVNTTTLPPGTWTFPFTGVEVLHRTTASPLRNIWAVRVNLDAPGVSMAATAFPGSTHRTPREWAQLVGAQIAVNGDNFGCNPSVPICTWGLAAGFGAQWPAASNGGGTGVDGPGRGVVMFNDKSQIEFKPQAESNTFEPWAKHMIGTFGDVLRNGAVVTSPIGQECSGRPPRTFGGISQDGRTLILGTVDSYDILTPEVYVGFTCQEIGAFLQELGAYHGVNFDGGNSTAMYIQGYPSAVPEWPQNENIVNVPANRTTPPGRVATVANHFGIFATPSDSKTCDVSVSLSVTKGIHSLAATAVDTAGNEGSTTTLSFTQQ
jgi:Phosphodiester glycosidase